MHDEVDPTRPLRSRSPEELREFIEDHLVMAMVGATHLLGSDRQWIIDCLRDHLDSVSDKYPTRYALEVEDHRRKHNRLRSVLGYQEADHG